MQSKSNVQQTSVGQFISIYKNFDVSNQTRRMPVNYQGLVGPWGVRFFRRPSKAIPPCTKPELTKYIVSRAAGFMSGALPKLIGTYHCEWNLL
jgi:hypothetical protein